MRSEAELKFESLVEAHYGALYRFALSLTRTETDACDLVQGTFAIWASKGHQLQDGSKVKTWLFTTLHRRFLETKRHANRFQHLEISAVEEELPEVNPEMVNRMDAAALVLMLEEVDPLFQAAVALFYLEDYSYNEIAEILEVPKGTVKSRISRGVGQLRELFLKGTAESAPKEGKCYE